MAYDFSTIDAQQASALIAASNDPLVARESSSSSTAIRKTVADSVRRFLAGDHWQDGEGWVGPKPSNTQAGADNTLALALIKERFVSRNMIEDITTRHTDGVVGREPAWGFTPARPLANDDEPSEDEQKHIDAIEAALTAWWDKRQLHALFQRVTTEMLLSGRAVIRLYVPAARLTDVVEKESDDTGDATDATQRGPKLVTADGATESASDESDTPKTVRAVVASTLDDALDHIFVELVISDAGTVYTDTDSMEQIGIVIYYAQGAVAGSLGPKIVETTYLGGRADVPREDRPTIIRIVTAANDEEPTELPLLGKLTHFAVVRPPLVNTSIISIQKALNLAISMLPRNVETSGFLERTLLNSQMPLSLEEDPGTGEKRWVERASFVAGAGATNYVQGAEFTNEDGKTQVLTPDIRYREPSPVTPTTEAIDALVAEILREAKQAHVLGTDQVQSGVSRVQARADFEKSLGRSQAALEPAGRWLLETALTMACVFAADTGGIQADAYRATFSCFTDTGPLDPQEKTTITEAVTGGLLSAEWGMQALGVEDTDAELARLNSEPGKRIELRTKKLTALKAGTDAGLSLTTSAKLAGFEDDEVTLIEDDEAANPTPAPLPGTLQQAKNPDGTPKVDETGEPVMEPIPAATPPAPPKDAPTPAPAVAA